MIRLRLTSMWLFSLFFRRSTTLLCLLRKIKADQGKGFVWILIDLTVDWIVDRLNKQKEIFNQTKFNKGWYGIHISYKMNLIRFSLIVNFFSLILANFMTY